ncbi:hypothetical protein MRX96_018664 [Rhipicephalus microplus]
MKQLHSTYRSTVSPSPRAETGYATPAGSEDIITEPNWTTGGDRNEDDIPSGVDVERGRWAACLSIVGTMVVVVALLLASLVVLSKLTGEWGSSRGSPTDTTEVTVLANYGASRHRHQKERGATCRTEACVAAADNVSLDTTTNPCVDLFGHVCNNWIKGGAGRLETSYTRSYRHTVDHAHQAALSRALHKILARKTGSRYRGLPDALKRLYRKCLKPKPEDGAELRSKLLDSAGVAPWPQPRRDTANAEDVSKVLGNAYYFTNEPVLLRMGVGADGLVFLSEPRLLLDGPAVTSDDVAKATATAFVSAGGTATTSGRQVDPEADRQRSAKKPQAAWASWNLRTVIEEAFEPREAISDVVVRAPNYIDALPDLLKQLKEHEILNYLGLRTALLASRLLPEGPEKHLLCRLVDVDDAAPANTPAEHCVRLIAKYEPLLALHALANRSSLVTGLDVQSLLTFLHSQMTSLVRADALDTGSDLISARLADRADALPWVGLAPEWLNNATTRQAYIAKFYGQAALSSRDAAPAVFAWMQDKVVNEHLALNDPDQFVNARWTPGLLSTRCRLVLREEETVATGGGDGEDDDASKGFPEATLQVPPAALDLLWATHPSTAMLQVARVGVRAYEPVLRYLLRWLQRQQRSKRNRCSKWASSSPRHLDAALESRALSLALRAFLAWPGASELVLPGLEHLNAEQLFFVFYALNQCEANGSDVEQVLAARHKPDASRAAANGGDGAAGRAVEGGVAEAEEDVVHEDEVERLASWLSLFRMLVIFLPLFALCMPSLLGDWERSRRNESSLASRRFMGFVTPPGASYRRQFIRTTCRSRACIVAASGVSLDLTANPCDDLFGHVCNNWIRDHRASPNAETWELNRDRRTVDHLHQAALTEDLHKILVTRADGRWLPVALHRLYSRCLKPGLKDAAELRSKLLDSAGLLSWPYNAGDKAHAKDISKAVGNAYYFTNEPAILRMGVGADGRAFVAEPRLLLDALTVGPREVTQAAAAVFLSAGGKLSVPEYVGKVEELLDKARRGDDPAPWNTTLRLPAKYEPELSLYALTALSPLVTGVDTESLLSFLRHQLSSEIRAGTLDLDDPKLADQLADRVYSMRWIGPAPSWVRNVTLREAYFMRFYEGKAAPVGSADTSQAMFAWMQEKAVNEHLATNGPHLTNSDQPWLPGLLSTRSILALREGEATDIDGVPRLEATLQVGHRDSARSSTREMATAAS